MHLMMHQKQLLPNSSIRPRQTQMQDLSKLGRMRNEQLLSNLLDQLERPILPSMIRMIHSESSYSTMSDPSSSSFTRPTRNSSSPTAFSLSSVYHSYLPISRPRLPSPPIPLFTLSSSRDRVSSSDSGHRKRLKSRSRRLEEKRWNLNVGAPLELHLRSLSMLLLPLSISSFPQSRKENGLRMFARRIWKISMSN